MSKIFLYTGQGAQAEGMGIPFMDYPKAVDLCAMASDISGVDVATLITKGTTEELKQTKHTQIAIATIQAAITTLLEERGVFSQVTAGFSLGEVAAYWNAGVYSTEEFFRIISLRGSIMEEQSTAIAAAYGEPGMAAVIGLDTDGVLQAIDSVDKVYGANYNSPNQTVIAGTMAGIEEATEALKAAGARRVLPLKVSGPFHTPLMESAATAFAEALAPIPFQNPTKTVYANATAQPVGSAEEAKKLLVSQITSPVRWVSIEQAILESTKTPTILEVGPGKVLAGLWKGVDRENSPTSVGDPQGVANLEL